MIGGNSFYQILSEKGVSRSSFAMKVGVTVKVYLVAKAEVGGMAGVVDAAGRAGGCQYIVRPVWEQELRSPGTFPVSTEQRSGRGATEPMGWKLLKIFPYVPLIGLLTTC